MAHELTHVANRDVLVMTLASFFATIAAYIVQFGFFFGGGGDDDDNPSFMILFLVSIGVYIVSFFLMQALSRYREFAADRGAALITGRPSALASALQRISSGMARIPQQDLRATQELAAFYIFPPGAGKSIARPVRDASADGEADRGAAAARDAAPGHGVDGPPRHPHRQAQDEGAGREPAVRDVDGRGPPRHVDGAAQLRQGGDRLPAARDVRLRPDRDRHGGGPARHRRGHGDAGREDRRQLRLPLDGAVRRGLRGPRRRRQRRLAGARGRRLRRADPLRGLLVPRPAGQRRSTGSTTTSAAPTTRSCPRAASSGATPSASCGSRPRSAASSRSSRSSSAGSRSGASRSSGAFRVQFERGRRAAGDRSVLWPPDL